MKWLDHRIDNFSIQLPEQAVIAPPILESDYYGARKTLCTYAGLKSKNFRLDKVWQHGWIRDQLLVDPAIVLTSRHASDQEESFLVATQKQQDYLKQNGYPNVQAVGLPIIYSQTPESALERLPNSLLVMPMHSLESTKRKSNFEEYAALINDLRSEFDFVLVCLHYACIRNNFWISEFEKYNIPWIEGANVFDQNCLPRLRALFSQFEYVTTNGYGSHLSYSAYFGAKTSIYGDFPARHPQDYVNDSFFRKFPHLLETYFPLLDEEVIKDDIPFLFCHPKAAEKHVEWGQKELGQPNKLTAKQARQILTHDRINQLQKKTKRAARHFYKSFVPDGAKHYFKLIKEPSYRADYERQKKIDPLVKKPHFQQGAVEIFGKKVHYLDGYSFYHIYNEVFNQKTYDFTSDTSQPFIIDIGANVGLSVLYFKRNYPDAEIVAFEPDSRVFEFLERNVAAFGWKDVHLMNNKVPVSKKELVYGETLVKERPPENGLLAGEDRTLYSYLEREVDLLKISTKESAFSILEECQHYLSSVRRICLTYYCPSKSVQQLDQLLNILKVSGFTYYVDNPVSSSHQPFMKVRESKNVNMQLIVYGVRQ